MAKGRQWLLDLRRNLSLLIMLVPGIIYLIIFGYMPMFGIFIAFKNIDYSKGIFGSDWVGFKNFEFFYKTPDMFNVTRNTVLYNGAFIIIGLILAVSFAIMLSEIRNRLASKIYQTIMFFPHFLSWVVVSYISFAFFNTTMGFFNTSVLKIFGIEPIAWYLKPGYWPVIITAFHYWKSLGYSIVVYLAAIAGINAELYEAAAIDGASKFRQIISITLPGLKPIMTILTILNIGKIFNSDFGLFYQTTLNSGALYETTNVLDTYVFRAFRMTGDLGMASAAGFYQSIIGFILVISTNAIVRKIDNDNALF